MSQPERRPSWVLRIFLLLGLSGAVVLVAWGIHSRKNDSEKLEKWTEERALPTVRVTQPEAKGSPSDLTLPGRLEAFKRAAIYSRVDGYLKEWYKDIGSRVEAGELLAVIDTPDLDQELMQARADLNVRRANADLANRTAKRFKKLELSDVVSEQDLDQKLGDLHASQAAVKAAEANVRRLEVLETYADLKAPFDGLVTMRNTDIGALIAAGSDSGMQLFEVSDISKIRVYIRVPQNYVPMVPAGTEASITVPEYPKKSFKAQVYASAGSVYANSNTTLMQLLVDNQKGELLPGGYSNVSLELPAMPDVMQIPSSAVIFNAEGLNVATVDDQGTVSIKDVTIARNHGKFVDIDSGLSTEDTIIINPPDGVSDGTKVKVAQEKEDDKAQKKAEQKG